MKRLSGLVLLLCLANFLSAQDMHMDTYCNPLNIDYTYMIYNSDKNISYRSGADPAVVEFRGEYYMFVTRSHGYWRSRDLLNWEFVRPGRNWYPQGCNAPAAHNYKDSVLYVTGDPSGSMSMLKEKGAKKIHFMCIIASPEGIEKMHEIHPDVDVFVGALDDHLNEHGYIVPGLGDAGDRIFGTK